VSTGKPNIFTIGAGAPFAVTLAKGLIARLGDDRLALSGATIYLPTRRAARGFGEAFAAALGGSALLPQFRALGDADEDDLLFDADSDIDLIPAISPLRRQLLLAHLVRRWDAAQRGGALSFAQSAALARTLAALLDEIATQGGDPALIAELVPLPLAEHWQEAGGFLAYLYEHWPALLAAEGKADIAARRDQAIRALARRIEKAPILPDGKMGGMVIAAGSTGSIPATAELLGVIARLPNGALVLPGLDRILDDKGWSELDPGHPQYGLKQLLDRIGVARADVKDWPPPDERGEDGHQKSAAANPAREHLLSETLRPAPTTDAWRALVEKRGSDIAQGLQGLSLVEATDPAEEALAIALALREALETGGRSAALVTPDRNLARRVAAELQRWNIAIDDSAGRPLAHTSAGSFLCLVAEAAEARFAPVPLLALLKHPFARAGGDASAFRTMARALDLALRGPRPDPGLAGVTAQLEKKPERPRAPEAQQAHQTLLLWWRSVAAILQPLENLLAAREAALADLAATHLMAAEALACDDKTDCLLWSNTDGETAAQFAAALQEAAAALPAIETSSYAPLLRRLAMAQPVRAPYGQHPRLAILGPLEARLQHFDLTILGGLNEGTWPQSPGADPWFSRPMRATLGLEQPERGIGLAAHDFAMLAAGPQVLLTRALKADGAPTVPSRWLQRLTQLARGLNQHLPGEQRRLAHIARPPTPYGAVAARLLSVPPGEKLPRPHPTPPVAARPRRLSVTEIETWLRDPYAIYAKHVLGLKPLNELDEAVGPLERGTLLHGAVEEFVRRFPAALPADAADRLIAIAAALFAGAGIPKAAQAVWLPRFADAARGFLAVERTRRVDIATPHVELKGTLTFPAPGGDFTLTGRADRIDVLKGGGTAIVDYKSGAVPSTKQVEKLLAPQLPLEAAMLAEDGFNIGRLVAQTLIYISLADGEKAADPTEIPGGAALGAEALARLKQRVARFDEKETPYYPRVMPFRANSEGDYDHLARVREWSATAEEA
jgi:ATP-dependent helicase/nuclease subunit B